MDLMVINTGLQADEKKEIENEIDQAIEKYKNNRFEINRLVFESVTALTASENYSHELKSQGTLKRLWGGFTGRNRELKTKIDSSLAHAQYASQRTLQKLAEQNLMSFELITAVNNKLNASMIEIDTEINKIYGTLVKFFKQTKSEIIQLENRVERLERNVNLLNWQNSIEYQMWNGIEYADLDITSKIVCMVRDFYDITKGQWTVSDLLLLKSAMAMVGINPRELINYGNFVKELYINQTLSQKLFQGEMENEQVEPWCIAISSAVNKGNKLQGEDAYIVQSVMNYLVTNNIRISSSEVVDNLVSEYSAQELQLPVQAKVCVYDLMIELLFNLEQLKYVVPKSEEDEFKLYLENRLKDAELLFSVYDTESLLPILDELIEHGIVKAKYIKALLYETGCAELQRNDAIFVELLDECINLGYLPAQIRKLLSQHMPRNWEKCYEKIPMIVNELTELANEDMFAAAECAWIYINPQYIGLEKSMHTAQKAIAYCEKSPAVLRDHILSIIYYHGEGVEKNLEYALEYFKKAARRGYNISAFMIGEANERLWTKDCSLTAAGAWYKIAYELGNHAAITRLAKCYSEDNGKYGLPTDYSRFFELSMEAYKKGTIPTWGISNIGWAYQYGKGVNSNIEMAKKYYREAAEKGSEWAKEKLASL